MSSQRKCRYGNKCQTSKCVFKHPPQCWYGAYCEKNTCMFKHPLNCRYGTKCINKKCKYTHPRVYLVDNSLEKSDVNDLKRLDENKRLNDLTLEWNSKWGDQLVQYLPNEIDQKVDTSLENTVANPSIKAIEEQALMNEFFKCVNEIFTGHELKNRYKDVVLPNTETDDSIENFIIHVHKLYNQKLLSRHVVEDGCGQERLDCTPWKYGDDRCGCTTKVWWSDRYVDWLNDIHIGDKYPVGKLEHD